MTSQTSQTSQYTTISPPTPSAIANTQVPNRSRNFLVSDSFVLCGVTLDERILDCIDRPSSLPPSQSLSQIRSGSVYYSYFCYEIRTVGLRATSVPSDKGPRVGKCLGKGELFLATL